MEAEARRADLLVPAGAALAATAIGLLAGIQPAFAIAASLGVAFALFALVDLAAGLAAFVFLSFLAQVPNIAGPAVSFVKVAGLWLAISWVATLTVRPESGRAFFSAHPGVSYVLFAFLGWSALSLTWAEFPADTLGAVGRYALNVSLFLIVFTAVEDRRRLDWVLAAFVAGATVSAVYGLVSPPADPETAARLAGTLGNANALAIALVAGVAMSGGMVLALKSPAARVIAAMAGGICLLSLFLTVSRGGIVALGAMLLTAIIISNRYRGRLLIATGLVALITLFYFTSIAPPESRERITEAKGGTGRVDLWKVGRRMIDANPVTGVGAGNFEGTSIHYLLEPGPLERSDLIATEPQPAHNTYLEVFAELGAPGALMFLAIILFSLGCGIRATREFVRSGDRQMELLSTAVVAALGGTLAADVFGSEEFSKQLWLLLGLCPALLAMARSSVSDADRAAP